MTIKPRQQQIQNSALKKAIIAQDGVNFKLSLGNVENQNVRSNMTNEQTPEYQTSIQTMPIDGVRIRQQNSEPRLVTGEEVNKIDKSDRSRQQETTTNNGPGNTTEREQDSDRPDGLKIPPISSEINIH